jgi:hypothetical protein
VDADPPVFLGGALIARRLGIAHSTLLTWRTRHPEKTPPPIAFYTATDGHQCPLWREEQMPQWREFAAGRKGRS